MSTFFNTPDTPQTPVIPMNTAPSAAAGTPVAPPTAIRTTPTDDVIIHRFREASPEAVSKLNADFGLSLTPSSFLRLQRIAREHMKRDITVAELRLLVSLDEVSRGVPDREAIGELITASPVLAETWADIMDKHATLTRSLGTAKSIAATPPPPCTYADALRLPERYLCRIGRTPAGGAHLRGEEEFAVLTAPWQTAVAVAAGYRPTVRLAHLPTTPAGGLATSTDKLSFEQSITVALRRGGTPRTTPARVGDYLLHLPAADLAAVADLLAADRSIRRPAIAAIRAVADASYIDTILAIAPGADVYTGILLPPEPTAPAAEATTEESVNPAEVPAETVTEAPAVPTEVPAETVAEAPAVPAEVPAETVAETPATSSEVPAETVAEAPAVPSEVPAKTVAEAPAVPSEVPAETVTETPATSSEAPAETVAEAPAVPSEVPAETVADAVDPTKNANFTATATVAQPRKTVAPPRVKIAIPRLSVEKLVARHRPDAERADFILRVSPKDLPRLSETLRARGIRAAAIGRVTDTDALRLFLRTAGGDIPVALIPAGLLRQAATVHLHRVEPAITEGAEPLVNTHRLMRLPGTAPREDGISPYGHEVVAVPVAPTTPVTIRDIGIRDAGMTLSAASVTVTEPGTGFEAAVKTAEAATRPLLERGVPSAAIRLAVSVTVNEGLSDSPSDGYTPGACTAEVLCGLYRAVAENGLLPADPAITVAPPDGTTSVSLTVTAWHLVSPTKLGRMHSDEAPPLCLLPVLRRSCEPSLRAIAASLSGFVAADCRICPVAVTTREEPVPTEIELSAAETAEIAEAVEAAPPDTITRDTITRDTITRDTITRDTITRDTITRDTITHDTITHDTITHDTITREVIIPASAAALAEHMHAASAIFLAMSTSDARLLLADETIRAAIDRAVSEERLIVVCGEAVAAFAECGLLPATFADLTTYPATGVIAEVSHPLYGTPNIHDLWKAFLSPEHTAETAAESTDETDLEPSETARDRTPPSLLRLVRRDLLVPAHPEDTAKLFPRLAIHLPDGATIPDAYTDGTHAIIAVLNGLDPILSETMRIFATFRLADIRSEDNYAGDYYQYDPQTGNLEPIYTERKHHHEHRI